MTEGVKHLLREIKDGLAAIYGQRLQAAYLYGSYARGEEDSESDLDVLVVLDKVERYGAEIDQTGELISTNCLYLLPHGVLTREGGCGTLIQQSLQRRAFRRFHL